jgi:hypothetical protein
LSATAYDPLPPEETPVLEDVPVPLNATWEVESALELLAIAICPVYEAALVGSNWTLRVAVCPEFSVSGKLKPDTAKPVPLTVAELTVTELDPEALSVKDWVAALFSSTLPKLMVLELTLRVEAEGASS